ncbi:hypothetical protein CEP52_004243 [Fusarium oligoseptatum]|uniref:Uncharacterized protein n=1 Tax=Fusarium oligoseptatum TaxID=2604345 RepID=A0A428U4K2_9HYPO|nr:hypothetical protein CEP52_004243 [Fusarium oligoseptatum]
MSSSFLLETSHLQPSHLHLQVSGLHSALDQQVLPAGLPALSPALNMEDDEDAPSTGEARADDNVVVISDEGGEKGKRTNAPPSPTTNNSNAAVRARPTTGAGSTASSSIVIEDSDDETPILKQPSSDSSRPTQAVFHEGRVKDWV